MKVLLLMARSRWPDYRRFPPLGLLYLASTIRGDHKVRILDESCGRAEIPADFARNGDGACVAGFSVSVNNLDRALALAAEIKRRSSSVITVFGGPQATMAHRELIERCPDVDYVLRGEAESNFSQLLTCLAHGQPHAEVPSLTYRDAGQVRVNANGGYVSDLSRLPCPSRDLIDLEAYISPAGAGPDSIRSATVLAGRGCPFRCTFCSVPALSALTPGATHRRRDPESIAEEVEHLARNYRLRRIQFVDDNFFLSPPAALEVLETIARRGLRLEISFTARADLILRGSDLLPKLKALGLRSMEVGVESGADSALRRFNKGLSVETNSRALRLLRSHGIGVGVDFIMFDPDCTVAELASNLRFLRTHGFETRYQLLFHRLHLMPGAMSYDTMLRAGRILGDPVFSPDYEFQDPAVREIWQAASVFRAEALPRIESRLQASGPDARGDHAEWLAQRYALSRLPFDCLDSIVRNASAPGSSGVGPAATLERYLKEVSRLVRRNPHGT